MNATTNKSKEAVGYSGWLPGILTIIAAMIVAGAFATGTVYGKADNFTDIFYTNSFRGAFEWVQKLDWVGMIVQIVISTFSLFGVALLVIRIMTSMLFLSAKGMWEEVHDLKSSGESAEKDFLGMFGMAKTWASGKSGTGLDAIIGAVLLLLPDVKRYSDFGEKSGNDFSDDITISQYMLKIALPTVMTVFFFAMGFNGTLFQALAVTVDGMGSLADQFVSVNFAGIVDDLANSNRGYKFSFDADGTKLGKLKQSIAKDIYGKLVTGTNANPDQLYQLGVSVENTVLEQVTYEGLAGVPGLNPSVAAGLGSDRADNYVNYLAYEVRETSLNDMSNALFSIDKVAELNEQQLFSASERVTNIMVLIEQNSNYNGNYFNDLTGDTGGGGGSTTITGGTTIGSDTGTAGPKVKG